MFSERLAEQNRSRWDSELGKKIAEHRALGIQVHLFARAKAKVRGETQPFVYCGELHFRKWEGDKPITVWWEMGNAVPAELLGELGIKGK